MLFTLLCFLLCLGSVGMAAAIDLNREIVLTPPLAETLEDHAIRRWQRELQRPEATAETWERLAWAYVAKARRTLDPGFYKLAEKTADVLEAAHGRSPEAALVRGHVRHNLHQFRESEAIARQLVAVRGGPADLALLCDVLVDLGQVSDAVAVLQRLVNLKPGVEAYSRVSHLRWLKGDLAGADAALTTALRAAHGEDREARAWLLCRKAALQLQRGDAPGSLAMANAALAATADYPPALFARGRALLALARADEAVADLARAEELNPMPEYQWWLADALDGVGRGEAAEKVRQRLRRKGEAADPRTLAMFLATRRENVSAAVSLAERERAVRGDIFSHGALAWARVAAGDLPGAQAAMRAALAEGTCDARLDLYAGHIAYAAGQASEAETHFARALSAEGMLTPTERALLRRPPSTRFSGAVAGPSHQPTQHP
jgi:tetratricopeptide (TPR) repeat protein